MNYFFARVLRKLGLVRKLNFSVQRKVNSKEICIPILNGLGFENLNVSELWMCELLRKLIAIKKGVFIDVGVNVGQTLIKLKTIDPLIEYVGFEPNPKCVYYSDILIKANQFDNCKLIPVGIFNEDTVLLLNLYSEIDTDSSASIIDDFRPGQEVYSKIFVPVCRFEGVSNMLQLKSLSIIKIDVEGAELEVLISMKNNIKQFRPFILMEILPCYTEENTRRIIRQEKLESILLELNYKVLRIIKSGLDHIEKLHPVASIGIHGDMELCEYVLCPEELTSQLSDYLN